MLKPLAFLLLISHINFSMFIAQVDEVDAYAPDGSRINDINCMAEFIHDIVLHKQDKTREDEDDDNARYFHPVNQSDYSLSQQILIAGPKTFEAVRQNPITRVKDQNLHAVFYDVITPPPKVI
jgi:hypothetical protein